MRHDHDQQPVHPTALMLGADLGMGRSDMRKIISDVGEKLPDSFLFGGYNADVVAISACAVMRLEDEGGADEVGWFAPAEYEDYVDRIVEVLRVVYQGLI